VNGGLTLRANPTAQEMAEAIARAGDNNAESGAGRAASDDP
jgi:hypothetical protein